MKQLVLIIHAGLKQSTADLLRGLDAVSDFTLTDIEGHGTQMADDSELSDRDKVIGFVPRLRVDILLEDSKVESVLAEFRAIKSGENQNRQQSMYWVTDVKERGRF